ncbi:ankyrin repeat-containing domain protein, partial [Usnea florida]
MMEKMISMIADFDDKGLNAVDEEGETALGVACRHSHSEIVNVLIIEGANINSVDTGGYTALMTAIEKNSVDCTSILLQHGADVRVTNRDGATALHFAAHHETPRIMEMILQSSAAKGSSLYTRDNDGWSLLHDAACAGWLPTIEYILEHFKEASPFDRLQDDSTCLHLAAKSGRVAAVRFFLDCGLSADDYNKGGETPVYSAISSINSLETIQVLHTMGADLDFPSLYLAACNDRSFDETLPLLLSKGADVSRRCTTSQKTALHVAAMNGDIQAIEVLLAHGADMSATDSNLSTPYLLALEEDKPHAASRLLERMTAKQNEDRWAQVKGDIGPIDDPSLGKALRRFSKLGQAEVVEILLDHGVDVNCRSRKGTTAVMKASQRGHLEVLDLLKDRGADFTAKNSEGDSALAFACLGLKSLVVPGLLELGLKFTDSNFLGWTPLHGYALSLYRAPFNEDFHDVVMAHAMPTQLSSSQLSLLLYFGRRSLPMLEWILSSMDTAQKKDAINNLNHAWPSFALHRASFEGSVEKLDMLLDAGAEIDLRNEKISPPLACAASMGRMEAVQFLAKKGAKFEYSKPDGTKENAIDAAKNYPRVQQWMREFWEEKQRGMESECAGSDQRVVLGTIEEEDSE